VIDVCAPRVPIWNIGLARAGWLQGLLGRRPAIGVFPWRHGADTVWLGWGAKPSAYRASAYARMGGSKAVRLEDGFLRSYGTGDAFPPLALVVDDVGIYYDSTRPSALENLLNSEEDLLGPVAEDARRAKGLLLGHRLSKYNHAPDWVPPPAFFPSAQPGCPRNVLVVDQTAGDLSVSLGGATRETFESMLAAARAENPGATIFVKTHPEVTSGRKRGYLANVPEDARTVVLRDAISPLSLVEQMDRVYVVTSTMGFEALLAGKPVTCFGLPWYAGWGVTDDRLPCPRRIRRRSVDELFAAAYFHYTRYLDPVAHAPGSIFDVIDWLVRQKQMAARLRVADRPARVICVGLRRWKAANLHPMLSLDRHQVAFVPTVADARGIQPRPGDHLVFWGATPPAGLLDLADASGARAVRMEDGFVRSVGLGSDLIRPMSLVLDEAGIYFDPTRPSGLEQILQTARFGDAELATAGSVRELMVRHGITKYNIEPRTSARWAAQGRSIVLVPGQVEDDASIRLGCGQVRTNLGLLQAVRASRPDAFIVYKPHPDVSSGNRDGKLALAEARRFADHVETRLSVISCIDACDEVHTMTSLTGFDALLRGKKVVTFGQPFYAGWGLTEDRMADGVALARRTRRLSVDELVAGALLRYPLYWDWQLKGYTSCEAVIRRIIEARNALEARGRLENLRVGFVRRQSRKLQVLTHAWLRRG
jgi:capsular polysaccharide export protein